MDLENFKNISWMVSMFETISVQSTKPRKGGHYSQWSPDSQSDACITLCHDCSVCNLKSWVIQENFSNRRKSISGNCFQKYFGRVITNASALSPAFFVASTLMESQWNFVELFFLQYVIISRRHSDLSPCVRNARNLKIRFFSR